MAGRRSMNEDGQMELDQNQEQETQAPKQLEVKAAQAERSMRRILDAMPKKSLEIPDDPLNPADKIVTVGVNGVIYAIPRGVEVEVPEVVYNVWKESDRLTKAVQRRIEKSTQTEVVIM